MSIQRYLNLAKILEKKTIFLFGPRQTGKSWLIRNTLQHHKVYNLLQNETFLKFNHSPERLREEKKLKDYIVVCCEKEQRVVDNIKIMPWRIFLEELWQ